jgi:hypothetical protein
MTSSRSGIARYRVVLIGLVLVIGGVAAAGCFLTAAGRHSIGGAIVLGVLAGIILLTGVLMLWARARRRGGLLSAKPKRPSVASTGGCTGTHVDRRTETPLTDRRAYELRSLDTSCCFVRPE